MAFSGEKLRQIRRQQGLSQRNMPVAHDTVSALESGRRNPHPSTLRKLAEALGVEVRDFFEEAEAAPKSLAPRSFDELLEAAGVADSPLALTREELRKRFDSLESYEEFRELAAGVIKARQAINPILDQREHLPPGEDLKRLKMLWSEAFHRTMIARLRYQGAANREADLLRQLKEQERALKIEEEVEKVLQLA